MTSVSNANQHSSPETPVEHPPRATSEQRDRLRKLTADCGYPLEPADELPARDAAELIGLFGRLWNEQHPKGNRR